MELSYLMLTGSLSGLISILAHSVLWSGVELVRGGGKSTAPGPLSIAVSEALLHMLCGIGLGALFWLSWGLAAVVDVAWWVRGLAFAGLCWTALAVPLLLDLVFARQLAPRAILTLASRWGTTCAVAGLACAWSWERML